jgi:hypothetical protein
VLRTILGGLAGQVETRSRRAPINDAPLNRHIHHTIRFMRKTVNTVLFTRKIEIRLNLFTALKLAPLGEEIHHTNLLVLSAK